MEPSGGFLELDSIKVKDNMEPLIITEEEIVKKLQKLKIDKSPGPDCLHPRVLREISAEIRTASEAYFLNLVGARGDT
jgi:hypothetical protein